jgi:hypothetical protein
MFRHMFLLVMLGTFLALGGFWALRAQDPTTPQTPTTTTTQMEPQKAMQTSQVDLSGTYTGTFVNCDAGGLSGEQTLTINGSQFTTADGKSGRIIASKTRGYTAVALQMSGAGSPVMSFRGKKSGNRLTLSPIAGATSQCMFTTSKSMASKTKTTPTATGTEVANPSTTPSTMPSQSPSPTPSPSPEASPEPNPSPSGSPRPRPSPSEPMPSPTPSPSPSPRM